MTTVLITGSAGGIGSATVRAFLTAGHNVIGFDLKPGVQEAGYEAIVLDLANEVELKDMCKRLEPINHLVVIAGGALPEEKSNLPVTDLPIQVFRQSIENNLITAFSTIQAALPNLLKAKGDKSITLTTSTDAFVSYGLPGYAAAKAGIIGLVHSLTGELGFHGIRINAVAPGDVPTPRNQREWAHRPEWYPNLAKQNPLNRLCTPEEIAETFLALSVKLTGMTGQILTVDAGGLVSKIPYEEK